MLEDYAYDPWGRRRDPATWKPLSGTAATARGFTGHEHIDLFELVNMDGRVYDPRLGRFLSPDPYVQDPTFSQSLNRYSYCWNNPLTFTDPTGHLTWVDKAWNWAKKHKQVVVTATTIVVAAAVTVITAGAASPLLVAAIGGAVGGFAGGALGAALDDKGFWGILGNGLLQGAIGFASGYVGGAVGQWAAKGGLSIIAGAGYNIASPILKGAIAGLIGGAAGGFAGGFTAGFVGVLLTKGDLESAFKAGWKMGVNGAMMGAGIGAIAGGYTGYRYAKANGINPLTGKPKIKIPEGWVSGPSKKGGGIIYRDPNNPHNNLRIMPGNPDSPNPAQQHPYVKYNYNGIPYDSNGNPLPSGDLPESHIPIEEFDLNKMPH